MHETVPARENFHKRAELLHRDHASLIGLADLNFACHAADNFFRACHALAAGGVDVYRAVVLDVNFGASLRDDALDRFAARPNERADFLRINFDCLDAWRVLR